MTIVISAVNIVEGGALTILQNCLDYLASSYIAQKYEVIAIVNSRKLFNQSQSVRFIEFPKSKKHYFYRLYYEYIAFKKLSKKLRPKLWLSLHDMSPKVDAEIQAVYMHNSIPFYKPKIRDWRYVPINAIWAYLYKYIYRINIHSNNYLIVQQNWLRDAFSSMFFIPKDRIIVARPNVKVELNVCEQARNRTVITFFYPAFPRVFKNLDVICKAARLLEKRGINNVRIILTIDGSENGYSKDIKSQYSKNGLLNFVGLLPHKEMKNMYDNTDCLLFPSKLETWGLPLSEFKPYGKPMIVADLPYAHETVAGASKVCFFNPDSAEELSKAMMSVINGDFAVFKSVPEMVSKEPKSGSWEELFKLLLGYESA